MTFTPLVYVKGDQTRVAKTAAQSVYLEFNAWQRQGVAPAPARSDIGASLADLDALGLTYSTRSGVRMVPWGDSTTAADSARFPSPSWGQRDFWAWAHVLSGGAFQYVQNGGVAGDDTSEALVRFQSDVAAYSPNIVPIVFGINDAVSAMPLATFSANIREMVRLVRSIGATPWLATVSGNVNTGGVQQRIATYNLWIRQYAAAEGLALLDIASVMTNPADGKIPAAYDLDGTHQNAGGAKAIGQKIATMVADLLPKWTPPLPVSGSADSLNLVANGLFLSGAATPTSWANTAGTPSIITGDTAIKGNWARLTDNGVATSNIRFNSAAGIAAGNLMRFVGRFRQVQGTSTTTTALFFTMFGTTTPLVRILKDVGQDVDGAFCVDVVAPAAITSWQVQMARTCTVAGNGYSQLAQVGVYNLTALGLA